MGLSPRVRGNHIVIGNGTIQLRSIPACAGEPSWGGSPSCVSTVYPRVCGGTLACASLASPSTGLSPRVRGNLAGMFGLLLGVGSIPACAGEPPPVPVSRPSPMVYPRVCGGTNSSLSDICLSSGLSPRVRGNHPPGRWCRGRRGSIPACAGEPLSWDIDPAAARVYPRVCGGTVVTGSDPVIGWGLSPRVRGNLEQQPLTHVFGRSIPACAGEPTRSR